ncbi:NAD(P)(+) transhydrogenase (AB-specific) subunit alpha domain-containing protein [Rhizobium sp. CIAT894]|nr:NAD(P)(+) transhydrogenase (AB-specific) subunit alpha domain-containing protein [Rhizobium sp. CIAT894]
MLFYQQILCDLDPPSFRATGEVRMNMGAPRERAEGEARVAMTPDSARQLMKLGY